MASFSLGNTESPPLSSKSSAVNSYVQKSFAESALSSNNLLFQLGTTSTFRSYFSHRSQNNCTVKAISFFLSNSF